jgi:hypothetical protein
MFDVSRKRHGLRCDFGLHGFQHLLTHRPENHGLRFPQKSEEQHSTCSGKATLQVTGE